MEGPNWSLILSLQRKIYILRYTPTDSGHSKWLGKRQNENFRGRCCRCSAISICNMKAAVLICAEFSSALRNDIFAGSCVVTALFGAGVGKSGRANISSSVRFRKKIASFGFIRCLINLSCRAGFSNTSSIMKCCTPLCPTKRMLPVGGEFTPTNFIAAKKRFHLIGAPENGRTKISRAFCADLSSLQDFVAVALWAT